MPQSPAAIAADEPVYVVVDRLAAGGASRQRVRDSLETAFAKGARPSAMCSSSRPRMRSASQSPSRTLLCPLPPGAETTIDGRPWRRIGFSNRLACDDCGLEYPDARAAAVQLQQSAGGLSRPAKVLATSIDIDMDLVVPDPRKTLREGAIAPWNTPAYAHELEELLALAGDYDLPVDVPFAELTEPQRRLIEQGVPERKFGGLAGFFAWLERRKYKMHIRVFLSRWRSYRPCPACGGARLRPEALATRVGGQNIAEICAHEDSATPARSSAALELARVGAHGRPDDARPGAGAAGLSGDGRARLSDARSHAAHAQRRRGAARGAHRRRSARAWSTCSTCSTSRRSACTRATSTGWSSAIVRLARSRQHGGRRRARRGDASARPTRSIEIGPGAGERGGEVVFQGTPARDASSRPTASPATIWPGRRGIRRTGQAPRSPITAGFAWPARAATTCKNVTVEFPLGVLCLVTGVSGAGKSTLVAGHALSGPLPPACARTRPSRCDYDDVFGDGQIDDVILVDQSPIGRSPRSNPVTYIKAFDEIRAVFAETRRSPHAQLHGRPFQLQRRRRAAARACEGDGYIEIDMQFLADVYMKCSQCERHALPPGDSRRQVPRPEHRRRAGDDRPRGVHLLPRPAEGAGPAEAADRRGARLPAARPAGQHALRRRGPAAEAGRLHVGRASAAARCSSSTSRPPACTLPTSCNCSIASTRCWPSAIR